MNYGCCFAPIKTVGQVVVATANAYNKIKQAYIKSTSPSKQEIRTHDKKDYTSRFPSNQLIFHQGCLDGIILR